jgi:hypothetical protein
MPQDDGLERHDVEAVLETRRELGLRYDAVLVDGFADRIEKAVEKRVADELADRRNADRSRASAGPRQLALGIVSTVAGIPISAIALAAGEGSGLPALLVSWAGLVGVNVAHAWQSRR